MNEPAAHQPDKRSDATGELSLTLHSFEGDGFSQRQLSVDELASLDASLDLTAKDQVRWLEVRGKLDEEAIPNLSSALQLHPFKRENLATDSQRPTLAVYDDYVYITMRYLLLRKRSAPDANADDDTNLRSSQVSLLLRNGLLVTFDRLPGDPFKPLKVPPEPPARLDRAGQRRLPGLRAYRPDRRQLLQGPGALRRPVGAPRGQDRQGSRPPIPHGDQPLAPRLDLRRCKRRGRS